MIAGGAIDETRGYSGQESPADDAFYCGELDLGRLAECHLVIVLAGGEVELVPEKAEVVASRRGPGDDCVALGHGPVHDNLGRLFTDERDIPLRSQGG